MEYDARINFGSSTDLKCLVRAAAAKNCVSVAAWMRSATRRALQDDFPDLVARTEFVPIHPIGDTHNPDSAA